MISVIDFQALLIFRQGFHSAVCFLLIDIQTRLYAVNTAVQGLVLGRDWVLVGLDTSGIDVHRQQYTN